MPVSDNDNPILLDRAVLTELTDELARRVILITPSLRGVTQQMIFINIACMVDRCSRKELAEQTAAAWEARRS